MGSRRALGCDRTRLNTCPPLAHVRRADWTRGRAAELLSELARCLSTPTAAFGVPGRPWQRRGEPGGAGIPQPAFHCGMNLDPRRLCSRTFQLQFNGARCLARKSSMWCLEILAQHQSRAHLGSQRPSDGSSLPLRSRVKLQGGFDRAFRLVRTSPCWHAYHVFLRARSRFAGAA